MSVYDQNSEDIIFQAKEFVEEFTLRHKKHMTKEMINDLFLVVADAYGDGFIAGFNLGVMEVEDEWWLEQDSDEEWINEQSIKMLEELNEYTKDMPDEDLPPGMAIDRRKKDE